MKAIYTLLILLIPYFGISQEIINISNNLNQNELDFINNSNEKIPIDIYKTLNDKIKIVGVSTLTSLNNKDLKQLGYNRSVENLVMHQAKLARKANLDALVCSPHEVQDVKKYFKKEIITPGIRLNSTSNDQKRVTTPKEAL